MSLLICTVNIKDRKSMDRSSKKYYFPFIRVRYILQSLNIPGKKHSLASCFLAQAARGLNSKMEPFLYFMNYVLDTSIHLNSRYTSRSLGKRGGGGGDSIQGIYQCAKYKLKEPRLSSPTASGRQKTDETRSDVQLYLTNTRHGQSSYRSLITGRA